MSEPRASGPREAARLEAFSDGVFAIAITLLALELRVPHGTEGASLGRELLRLWPSYAAFLTSFATIGIMWLNHHRLFTLIERVDHGLLIWNALLLLGVTAVCFPTSLVANYLGHDGERLAAAVYAGVFLLISFAYGGLWRHVARPGRHPRLLAVPDDHAEVRSITGSYRLGPLFYTVALGLAYVLPPLSVAFMMAVALYWAVQSRPVSERARR